MRYQTLSEPVDANIDPPQYVLPFSRTYQHHMQVVIWAACWSWNRKMPQRNIAWSLSIRETCSLIAHRARDVAMRAEVLTGNVPVAVKCLMIFLGLGSLH